MPWAAFIIHYNVQKGRAQEQSIAASKSEIVEREDINTNSKTETKNLLILKINAKDKNCES